ncbi:Swarming motility protein SwrB [Metabacillus sediminilitoris]|uniref:Swarming motility protein SwrB n=1 Tax=Metabacillus sediminilitoris TaxID=2567941 RepID=A0A4S4C586_9BACI|nr:Swarming motility protein SwrB [Metabacillus sediminilitoris]QGQ46831.1 Swarming motility protein SwrB [Metabacillus sediminilitoris]THF82979.1 Swarming motility protein SwrB [Metabacillus sediminilitoris]
MTTILLLISLLLHVVAFYFIVVLYSKYSTIKDLADSQRDLLEEAEQALTSFLIEIKDENEKLLQNLEAKGLENSTNEQDEKKSKVIVQSRGNAASDTKQEPAVFTDEELPQYLPKVDEIEDIIEINNFSQKNNISFEIEAINLHEKGHTVEQIAKKLNKGKTEIGLLLKFRQK